MTSPISESTSAAATTVAPVAVRSASTEVPSSEEGHEALLHELLGGPVRPFHEWKWHEAANFKKLHETRGDNSFTATNVTGEIASGCTGPFQPYPGAPCTHSTTLLHERVGCEVSCKALCAAVEAPRKESISPLCEDTAMQALTPLLDNYTIPISHQGPEYFDSGTQASVASICVIMVGLPARGKTFLAQKICRLLGWHGSRAKVLNVQVAWRRLILEYKKCRKSMECSPVLLAGAVTSQAERSIPSCSGMTSAIAATAVGDAAQDAGIPDNRGDECISAAQPTSSPSGSPEHQRQQKQQSSDYLGAEHFRALVSEPDSMERRMYRRVLERYAVDAKSFYANGGEVLVVNDDFPTEELRDEAEALFSPLASQTFFMEVIRGSKMNQKFNELKVSDAAEYPTHLQPNDAMDDFTRRVEYLASVYTTLTSSAVDEEKDAGAQENGTDTSLNNVDADVGTVKKRRMKRYVKLVNSLEIEVHGVTGFTASRIVSYVMNLTQMKVQHPIYFTRHGESLYNLDDRIGGDPSLTAAGTKGAIELLGFLASLKENYTTKAQTSRQKETLDGVSNAKGESRKSDDKNQTDSDRQAVVEIWTSQLRRAIQTVEPSETLLGIKTLRWSSLNEIHAGVCEDLTYAEVRDKYPLIDQFRRSNKYTFRYPEGESYQDLVMRLEPVIMELENADRVVVVVAHQAVLRALLAYYGSTSAESCVRLAVPHRTVWRCQYDSKGIASLDELSFSEQ
ncbi:putative 6-phosphofructo-2-kinase/fructose-2,6-biphosphatase [Trypanosoma grayi]|uniref:putative 6-phosphofructo-2-kinase/fructose-2,6-biphosphatase n=1 Tax=Trypanosoma grayi TaxID=71804 RepID=UPI0004F47B5D|nr:putative 6-phosphofructo-2-kinase/fructose-2,6-biphosphatase [Trypanosoma grayi]KEG06820.1 putative 6-phosphofructo-2-kinase/fructose-2,6-biphosphatase [Trypanosoma grayi]